MMQHLGHLPAGPAHCGHRHASRPPVHHRATTIVRASLHHATQNTNNALTTLEQQSCQHPTPHNHMQPVHSPENLGDTDRRHLLLSASALALQPLTISQPAHAAVVEEDLSVQVFEQSVGSVVSVITSKLNKAQVLVQQGVGSGFVWAQDQKSGLSFVVTNYHVISKLDKSTDVIKVGVRRPGSDTPTLITAELAATDTMNDLAVLLVDDPSLPPLPIGTSGDLQIGQTVYAIGAPYGLSSSLSAGVVSGLNRSIPSPVGTRIYGAIQTDASINAGNSGGPLLDSSMRVIGVNTATFTRSGTGRGSGVNFALPIDAVREIVPKLIVYGNAKGKRV